MTDVIASTKDRPGSYDAIETAKPGEPLFPIQGGDPFAVPTVLFWVDQCRKAGMHEEDPKKAEHLLTKARDAEMVAWQMKDYQRGITEAQAKDPKPDARPTYGGWTDQADAETLARRTEREGRIAAAGKSHNAIAMATEVADTLAKLRCCPEAEVMMREAIEKMREAARDIEPRRGNERT